MNPNKKRLFLAVALVALLAIGLWWPTAQAPQLGTQEVVQAANNQGKPQASAKPSGKYFTSPAGIYYGKDWSGKFETRLAHIMAHTQPDPTKPKHSVFREKDEQAVIKLLDEAWKKRGPPERQGGSRGRDVYEVDMGREVGTEGERRIRLIIEGKTRAEIITAYPVR